MTTLDAALAEVEPGALAPTVAGALADSARFVGLFATRGDGGGLRLVAVVADGPALKLLASDLPEGRYDYPALSPVVPAAFWYERQLHDLFGVVPIGHPRLDPLVFPLKGDGPDRPRPGLSGPRDRLDPDTSAMRGNVEGEGVFTIPYGPVRSGVFETVEFLVETFGEDIPQVRVRPHLKHRGVAHRFGGLTLDDGVALAERVEGTTSVAHAVAFATALESLAGVAVPARAGYQRLVHAELERIANHLDSMVRHTEGAGQAVAHARLSWAKERILRLAAALCGHRFGRGLVRPGGTTGPPLLSPAAALERLNAIEQELSRDLRSLMTTPSFLDRLRSTGPVPAETATSHGAVGPVGRGSGCGPDVRLYRPYGAYQEISTNPVVEHRDGDALARQWVRTEEIAGSFELAAAALERLEKTPEGPWSVPLGPLEGSGMSSVESPQGELVYLIEVACGRLEHVSVRTASFHNFALFGSAFRGDIFTDFVFIEASFGVNLAGVAG